MCEGGIVWGENLKSEIERSLFLVAFHIFVFFKFVLIFHSFIVVRIKIKKKKMLSCALLNEVALLCFSFLVGERGCDRMNYFFISLKLLDDQ